MDMQTKLDEMVNQGLVSFGWIKRNGGWSHPTCGHFLDRDTLIQKEWLRNSHLIRDSVRLKAWEDFCNSDQHELALCPVYDFGTDTISEKIGETTSKDACSIHWSTAFALPPS